MYSMYHAYKLPLQVSAIVILYAAVATFAVELHSEEHSLWLTGSHFSHVKMLWFAVVLILYMFGLVVLRVEMQSYQLHLKELDKVYRGGTVYTRGTV